MTVAKLVKMLQNMPQDAVVFIADGTTEDDIDMYTCYSKVNTSMKLARHNDNPCLLLRSDGERVRDYSFHEYS